MDILIFLFILSATAYNCTNQYKLACCKMDCPYCGMCHISDSDINRTYDDFQNNCCYEIIIKNNKTCNKTVHEPCVVIDNNTMRAIIRFFNDGPIVYIILATIGIFALLLFWAFACCIFGKRSPPRKYRDLYI